MNPRNANGRFSGVAEKSNVQLPVQLPGPTRELPRSVVPTSPSPTHLSVLGNQTLEESSLRRNVGAAKGQREEKVREDVQVHVVDR